MFHDIHPHCLTTKYGIIFPVWTLLTSFSCWFKFWLSLKSLNPFLDIMVLTLSRRKSSWRKQKATETYLCLTLGLNLKWNLPSPHLETATTVFLSHCFGKPNFLFPPGICSFIFFFFWGHGELFIPLPFNCSSHGTRQHIDWNSFSALKILFNGIRLTKIATNSHVGITTVQNQILKYTLQMTNNFYI